MQETQRKEQDNMITYIVHGEPQPKQRARTVRSNGITHSFTPRETMNAEKLHAYKYRQAGGRKIEDKTLTVDAVFYTKNRRVKDLDNMLKTVLDGLNRVAYKDDSQVWEIRALRRIDKDNPHTIVTITETA